MNLLVRIKEKYKEEELTAQDFARCVVLGRSLGLGAGIITAVVCYFLWQ